MHSISSSIIILCIISNHCIISQILPDQASKFKDTIFINKGRDSYTNDNILSLYEYCLLEDCDSSKFATLIPTGELVSTTSYPSESCITIETTYFGLARCSLPPYCGQAVYRLLNSTWFSGNVGACIGIGKDMVMVHSNGVVSHDGFLYRYKIQVLTSLAPIALQLNVLRSTDDQYYVLSEEILETQYPRTQDEYVSFPKMYEYGGQWCIPLIQTSTAPLILGPFTKSQAIGNAVYMEYGSHVTQNRLILGFFIAIDKGKIQRDLSYTRISCKPSSATTSLLPINFSYILRTSGHMVVVGFYSLIHLLLSLIIYLLSLVFHIVDPFIFILTLIYQLINSRRQLVDIVMISLIPSVILSGAFHKFLTALHYRDNVSDSRIVRGGTTPF